jgi:hypothetical protein
MAKELTNSEVRRLIRDEIEKFVTEKEVEKIIDKKIKDLKKDMVTREEVKKMIRQTIVNQYKYLWEKSNFFIRHI